MSTDNTNTTVSNEDRLEYRDIKLTETEIRTLAEFQRQHDLNTDAQNFCNHLESTIATDDGLLLYYGFRDTLRVETNLGALYGILEELQNSAPKNTDYMTVQQSLRDTL